MSTSSFPELNLPMAQLDLRNQSGQIQVYDRFRRKWVKLTPEEWVRQHFVAMLVEQKGYIAGRVANEISLTLNGMWRRCDTVVYDSQARPLVIVEYKAPEINITQAVFDQIARYCMVLRAPYLIVSNGMSHYCCHIDYTTGSYSFIESIPDYQSIV